MRITLAQLRALGACDGAQIARFRQDFGDQVELTESVCVAHAYGYDWQWAAENLLSPLARQAYDDAVAAARQAYDDAKAQAKRDFEEAVAPVLRTYMEAAAPAWRTYARAVRAARLAYDQVRALAFARAATGATPP